eukprot:SAG31_NODE_24449_length_481_cov_0.806283_1_plen_53_part_01
MHIDAHDMYICSSISADMTGERPGDKSMPSCRDAASTAAGGCNYRLQSAPVSA